MKRPMTLRPERVRIARSSLISVGNNPGTTTGNGYGSDWQRLRLLHLQTEPLCRHCAKHGRTVAATDVDHIVELEDDETRRLDPDNLQSLCSPCHGRKTMSNQIKRRNGSIARAM